MKLFFKAIKTHLCNKRTAMLLLLTLHVHIWNRTSHGVSCDSHWARSIHNFTATVAVLKWNKLFTQLSIMSVWIYCLVFVVARDGSYMLHWLRLVMLGGCLLGILVSICNRRNSIVLMIVWQVDVSCRPLRMIMMISSALKIN